MEREQPAPWRVQLAVFRGFLGMLVIAAATTLLFLGCASDLVLRVMNRGGVVFADEGGPLRPGRLRGVPAEISDLVLATSSTIATLVLAVFAWRSLVRLHRWLKAQS